MRKSSFFAFFLTLTMYSQMNMAKCKVTIHENFNPKVLNFSDNYLLMSAYNSNTLYLIGGKKTIIYPTKGYGVITAFIDTEEEYVVISNYHKTVDIHTMNNSSLIKSIPLNNAIAYAIKMKDERVFCGLNSGEILISSLTKEETKRINAHSGIIRDIVFIDNSRLLSIAHDGFLKVWDIEEDIKMSESIDLGKVLTKMTISPDQSKIAIACFDGSVIILDENFNKIKELKPNKSVITQIKFKDNQTFISSSFDNRIVSTNIKDEKYIELYKSEDYITNFDMTYNRFIFSDRTGKIEYYYTDCTKNKSK